MTILYANGYEVGTVVSELQSMTGEAWNSANMNTSGCSVSAASNGIGRSLKLVITNSLASSNTLSNGFNVPVTFPSGVGQVNFGWRGAITGTIPANASGQLFALRQISGLTTTTSRCFAGISNAGSAQSGPYAFNFIVTNAAGTAVGTVPFSVTDNNLHYYTITSVVVGSNRVTTLYQDITVLAQITAATFAFPTDMNFIMSGNNGGNAIGNRANIFTELDDVYVSVNESPLGDIMIERAIPTADVTAGFTRYGTGLTSNHQAIDKISIDDSSGLLVPVGTATDLYSTSVATPAGRRIAAVRTLVYGTGQVTENLVATSKSGATTVNSASTPLSPFGGIVDTGWDTTLANTQLSSLQFGLSKV